MDAPTSFEFERLGPADAWAFQIARRSLREYLKLCRIDCLPTPRPFGEVAEPWQWQELIDPLIPAIENLIRSPQERAAAGPYNGPLGFWNTYPRGHDKTSFIARVVNYILVFSRREVKIHVSVAAADQKQAAKIRNAMEREAFLNPWFGKYLLDKTHGAINKYDAFGPGGTLEILTSDAGSAYGGNSDFVVCDELTHWPKEALWVALHSETMKRQHCVMDVITNAGYKGTWQHKAMEQFKAEEATTGRWHVNDRRGWRASWMSAAARLSVRDNIIATTGSPAEAERLIDNIWVHSRQGSVFDPALIEACAQANGPAWIPL